ncbi:Rv3654c family TadE-like protein [Streptosporangium sp. NBC_01469]|uniref:Rv3654c family TadE-like protein n=1 Tax=Streptosporangium sp. NBC_01469 TaxID=2903898 RepID=UPI002E2A9AFC|nr:Rv3654c family TadE-like protein [Streptosporangium sp. NBC_01469]
MGAGTDARSEGGTGRANAQRGSATIWTVGLMALVFAVAVAVVFAGMARVARHRAQSAADLSALAAAKLAFADPGRSCLRASSLAVDNEARVTRCSLSDGGIADIEVAMEISLPLKGPVAVTSRARAGPVHIADPGP